MFAELHRIYFDSRIHSRIKTEHNTSNSRTADKCKSVLNLYDGKVCGPHLYAQSDYEMTILHAFCLRKT